MSIWDQAAGFIQKTLDGQMGEEIRDVFVDIPEAIAVVTLASNQANQAIWEILGINAAFRGVQDSLDLQKEIALNDIHAMQENALFYNMVIVDDSGEVVGILEGVYPAQLRVQEQVAQVRDLVDDLTLTKTRDTALGEIEQHKKDAVKAINTLKDNIIQIWRNNLRAIALGLVGKDE